MSRARRRRPDVRSAVRRAAARRTQGPADPRSTASPEGRSNPAASGSDTAGASRLAFLLDGSAAAPTAAPPAADLAASDAEPIRVRPAPLRERADTPPPPLTPPPRATQQTPVPQCTAPAPAPARSTADTRSPWGSRPAPRYRGDRDERSSALVAETADAWSALPAPLQTMLGVAIALPLAAAVALTRFAARFAGVRTG